MKAKINNIEWEATELLEVISKHDQTYEAIGTDENGKEIYEGDILKDNELIGKVVFASPSFIVETSTQIYALAKGLVMQTDLKDSEVIGNVYENPELLQEVTA